MSYAREYRRIYREAVEVQAGGDDLGIASYPMPIVSVHHREIAACVRVGDLIRKEQGADEERDGGTGPPLARKVGIPNPVDPLRIIGAISEQLRNRFWVPFQLLYVPAIYPIQGMGLELSAGQK